MSHKETSVTREPVLLGVDVGGTFTDAVLCVGGEVVTAKSPTTPDDQSRGVMAAIAAVLDRSGIEPAAVGHFAHGTTVGTNALLERRGARTALVTTAGFTDLLDIARQTRPSLYSLCRPRPPALVDEELRFGLDERMSPAGTVTALRGDDLRALPGALRDAGAESAAVCLLFSYVDPTHERSVAELLRRELPDLQVSVSSEVLPQFREYERCSTTVIDAYLAPPLRRYLSRLRVEAEGAGLPDPTIMRSSGGVVPATEAMGSGAWSVLSGPAGGAVGAALLAEASAGGNVLGFDMGGTSCDVCVVDGGAVRRTGSREIDGLVVQMPMVDVHTVGAGGGSIGWMDRGGALRVGPQSAGASPGPACYGNGGTEPTVTDANLVLGYLDARTTLSGGVRLDREAAHAVVAHLGERLGLGPLDTAAGIVRVANQEMIRALRVVTVERGVDPRDYSLMPFGGAGPMHAVAVAEELGLSHVVCPRAGGVLSALGLCVSDRRREIARTVLLSGDRLRAERIEAEVATLMGALGGSHGDARTETTYELRYKGQAFELALRDDDTPDPERLTEAFEAEHERRYGYRDSRAEVELVNIRQAVVAGGYRPQLEASRGHGLGRVRRSGWFNGRELDMEVLRGEPPVGLALAGPAVLELPETTLVAPPGWAAAVDAHGSVVVRREGAR